MKIVVTINWIMEHDMWEKFCSVTGLNEYAVAEGYPTDIQYFLTEEQAKEIGINISY